MDSKLFTLHTIETFWNKIKNKFYVKPANGIPKSDLDTTVQSSLSKADTALQKHQDISGKLDKTGDASTTTVAFSAASARENVKTGEKLSVIVGKIAKWFADFKNVAFTGSYNDLSDVPEEYKHPTYEENSIGFYKFANDGLGHVSDAEKVTKQDIVDLGIPGSIPIYNVDVNEEYGYSEGMIIATIVVNQNAHAIGVPIIGENENADYGLMSASDKTKLDGIADNANNYVHPTTSGSKHIPSGGAPGQILRWSAAGTAVWGADNNTTYNDATQSAHGLMTAADKKKLDGMDLSKYLPKDGTAKKANEATTLTDSGWVTCPLAVTGNTTYPTSASTIRVRKYGKMVKLEGWVKYSTAFNTGHNVATIPAGYRPANVMNIIGATNTGAGTKIVFYAGISAGGNIGFSPADQNSSATFNPAMCYEFHATYFID